MLSQPSELQMTNLQVIENFMRSFIASKNAFNVKGNKNLPVFIIIGTFYDKIKGSKEKAFESLRAKNELLLCTLYEFRDHFIFSNVMIQKSSYFLLIICVGGIVRRYLHLFASLSCPIRLILVSLYLYQYDGTCLKFV